MPAMRANPGPNISALKVITESTFPDRPDANGRAVFLYALDRSRTEADVPGAQSYQIERRDLRTSYRVNAAHRTYQEFPLFDLLSKEEEAKFLESGKHWRERFESRQPPPTREQLIRITYENTGEQQTFFDLPATRWLTTMRTTHEPAQDPWHGERWSESITQSWYLELEPLKARFPMFHEKFIRHAMLTATSSGERMRMERVGELPRSLCAFSETKSRSYSKVQDREAVERQHTHQSRITFLEEETVPETAFELPPGFRKLPLYPSRFSMFRQDLAQRYRRYFSFRHPGLSAAGRN